jgi:GNAT superfamily N-acetyltransferase
VRSSDDEVLIRAASVGDTDPIARVHRESWREAYNEILPKRLFTCSLASLREQWSSWLGSDDPDLAALVAERGGEVVGVALYECREGDDPELRVLYVHPAEWRAGIGRALVGAVADVLREGGVEYAVVWTFADNTQGRRFYESVGWALDGESDWEGVPIVRYRRQLERSCHSGRG